MHLRTRDAASLQTPPSVSDDPDTIPAQAVSAIGSIVEADDLATGVRLTYRLVEAHDAAPADGRLSIQSPVGIVLYRRCPGEVVTATTPRGSRRLRIIAVR